MKLRLGQLEIGLSRYLRLWAVVVFAFALQGWASDWVRGHTWSPWDYLRWSMVQWLTWAALAPLVFRLGERHPLQFPLRLGALGGHALYSLGVTLLAMIVGAAAAAVLEPDAFGNQLRHFLGKHVAIGLLTYWALLAVQQAMHFQAEQSRRELEASRLATELARSRLQVLKTQLQPHFLFNTLHAIVTLLDDEVVAAEDMLLRLSELLRAFLEDYDGQEIGLRRELELLELYLGIQRRRFKDRLSTRIYVAPDALDAAVPSLLLQPIAENAIRHGIGRHVGEDRVEIDCRRDGEALCIEVRNHNGALEAEADPLGHGIGLSNTRLRLQELYGDAAGLRLDMMMPRGVACRIRLPYRRFEDAAEGAFAEAPEPA